MCGHNASAVGPDPIGDHEEANCSSLAGVRTSCHDELARALADYLRECRFMNVRLEVTTWDPGDADADPTARRARATPTNGLAPRRTTRPDLTKRVPRPGRGAPRAQPRPWQVVLAKQARLAAPPPHRPAGAARPPWPSVGDVVWEESPRRPLRARAPLGPGRGVSTTPWCDPRPRPYCLVLSSGNQKPFRLLLHKKINLESATVNRLRLSELEPKSIYRGRFLIWVVGSE
eukprot:SAG22_NODE_160_length_16938_cov_3.491241_5_plen_231_part_00